MPTPASGSKNQHLGQQNKRTVEMVSKGNTTRSTKKQKIREVKENVDAGFFKRNRVDAFGYRPPSGPGRTCVADALLTAMKRVDPSLRLSKETTRAALPSTDTEDPTYRQAKEFAKTYGFDLVYDTAFKGSPKTLFRREYGVYYVLVEITPLVGEPDRHFVCYDAGVRELLDNFPGLKIPVIQYTDCKNNRTAAAVFLHFFPNSKRVQVLGGSEVRRIT
jgi:hypothetical protein